MCSERDSPLNRLYRRTHAKLTRLAGSGQLVWAAGCKLSLALVHARRPAWPGETSETILRVAFVRDSALTGTVFILCYMHCINILPLLPTNQPTKPRHSKCGHPIVHEWIDPWTLLLPGQHRWAQVGATDEPREFRLARSQQDKRLERAIPLTTHLCINVIKTPNGVLGNRTSIWASPFFP